MLKPNRVSQTQVCIFDRIFLKTRIHIIISNDIIKSNCNVIKINIHISTILLCIELLGDSKIVIPHIDHLFRSIISRAISFLGDDLANVCKELEMTDHRHNFSLP